MRVTRVVAPNPGLMTGPGTNTWIAASGPEAVVVDPGPEGVSHLDAVVAALAGMRPVAILVTHGHPDHAPAANPLAGRLGVPALGPAPAPGFRPDRVVADGEEIRFGDDRLVAVATPGHTADSTCYRVGDELFAGDQLMSGSTVVIEDLGEYLGSLRRLRAMGLRTLYPGHGPVVEQPDRLIDEYLAHRQEREAQILAALAAGARTVGAVVSAVYAEVDPALHPVAAISVDAHLRKLAAEGRVRYRGGGWGGAVELVP